MTAPTPVRTELFGPDRRSTTVGLVLLISLVAFEAMGVGTAMPALVADLGAVSMYAWPFVAFMAASVFGTVLGGRWCDRAGPRVPLVVAPVLFGLGLLVAGTAATMPQLLVGRLFQGLGAGALGVGVYVLIALVYPERARPAVFGLISSAWVLPSLIGPPVSGVVTEAVSWHWVFLGLVPFVVLAVALVVPAVRRLGPPDPGRAAAQARPGLVPAAAAAAVGVSGLSWAAQQEGAAGAVVAAVAVLLLVPAVPRLLPRGVFRSGRGVPTVVVARGLLAGVFFTVNSYLPLMLNGTHGWTLAAAGLPLIVGSLGWSSAAAWQGRRPDLPRARLLRIGFCALGAGTAGMLLVAPAWGLPWLALPFWALAGVGMGLGFSSVSFLLLQKSEPEAVGFHSSAAQIADQLTTALMIGLGGALLALLVSPAVALPVLVAVLVGLAALGAVVAGRAA
ncbi:MFS transporter [Pseudonocardia broussonetiae]|uniref:MFS transporter n=1 Tax=Pseudonocardia broussonetiae TaxID=2736640 RepID=A0A6M6JCT3_9PSEU|nr:MFS transporter [Pseudonocardia broussonetiae]QJY44883.1 MFS transporter [Pseudonocardia broussonetiae]